MEKSWKFSQFRDCRSALRFAVVWLLFQSLGLCWSLNDEGKALLKLRQSIQSDPFDALSNWIDDEAEVDPCNWFGVECSEGRVVVLNLKDLCLGGTLAPELVKLVHIKSIIVRNNSFFGIIPAGIVDLKELEVLDLGYNNFSGPLPKELGNNISLAILLLDNNELLGGFSPEINELKMLSEHQVDENQLTNADKKPSCKERFVTWNGGQDKAGLQRLMLAHREKQDPLNRDTIPPYVSPAPSPITDPASASPPKSTPPPMVPKAPSPNNTASPPQSTSSSKNHLGLVLAGTIGGAVLIILIIGIYLFKTNKVSTVKPWATGLSGQLQKAFVTGVPKLKRSELEAACEDFSNVICASPIGTVYKGTLSSGVEIAVATVTATSLDKWSKTLEVQFRKKIDTLSKVNHKNFINLLGYCEEDEPFTRMVVLEYAPNGTLFEHLHIEEAEHLDWGTRLRIAMGMAYCLLHMHQLDPPMAHSNLNSQAVYLTDDYAAKISDLSFLNEIASSAENKKPIDVSLASPKSNVYSFGVILFEMITGQIPYSVDNSSQEEDWASHYLHGDQPLREKVDPTLESFREDQLGQVAELIQSCVQPDPEKRPKMKEVTERLREITKITPDAAVPKLSPLWWAELEICSADGS